jgi:drug/metabolite transporter (DMT)-like permease
VTVAIALGLVAALAYGSSDFVAGLLSRRVHYAVVAMIGNGVACLVTIAALVATVPPDPTPQAVAWGAASGVGSGFGTLMLFRGLGLGRMGVVAPLSALGAAVLPVFIGVALGDRPSTIAWVGVAVAFPAIWLVSTSGNGATDGPTASSPSSGLAPGTAEGLLAGVAFAILFIALNLAGDGSGLWPVVAGQVTGVAILAVVLVRTVRRLGGLRLRPRDAAGAIAVGVTGAGAAVAYFLSTQAGLLSIVAVLTSLYPAATVLLARLVVNESISRRQAVGLAFAGAAVVLIVVG